MLLANIALPSFIGHWLVFILLLPLVAGIEAIVLSCVLKTPLDESVGVAVHANWRSTLVGLPAGWVMALVGLIPAGILALFLPAEYRYPAAQIIAFTAFTGGLIPTDFAPIAIAAGNLFVLFPYYIATVRVERHVVASHYPEIDRERIDSAVRTMNRITYAVLALLVTWWLVTAIVDYRNHPPAPSSSEPTTFEKTDGLQPGESQ